MLQVIPLQAYGSDAEEMGYQQRQFTFRMQPQEHRAGQKLMVLPNSYFKAYVSDGNRQRHGK